MYYIDYKSFMHVKAKILILLTVIICLVAPLSSKAQQDKVIEKKVALVHQKFESILKDDISKLNEIDNIFTEFYTQQEKIKNNIQKPAAPGMAQGFAGQDFQSVRKQNEKVIATRDEKLKKALSPDQYKIWMDEIEPSLKGKR
ncbi:MAG: hypothetical protein IPH58_06370 [Sphingobacteriales bacterium]|jgi:hypothetical protein|nr:hypothetical protein [Sphingobacteriales bacterium]